MSKPGTANPPSLAAARLILMPPTATAPEIFATPNALRGMYQVYANYYGGNSDNQVITRCKIAIISNENTPNEKQQNFIVPLRRAGELTLVKSFIY